MGNTSKAVGALLILCSIASFLVNFHLWKPWLLSSVILLWNPLSYFTPRVVGHIWLISSALGTVLNYVFALIYSAVLLIVGVIALLH